MKTKNYLLFSVTFLSIFCSNAQIEIQNQVLATSGASVSNSSIKVDYTLGEPFTETFPLGTQNVLTQGFQQPEVKPSSSLEELGNFEYSFFPNPFQNEFYVKIPKDKQMQLKVYDNAGRFVQQVELSNLINTLDFSSLANGNYQMILSENDTRVTRFSVVKN